MLKLFGFEAQAALTVDMDEKRTFFDFTVVRRQLAAYYIFRKKGRAPEGKAPPFIGYEYLPEDSAA